MSEPVKELRYPMTVSSLDELRRAFEDCPPWAVRKFAVDFEGRRLDYGHAHQVLRARGGEI